MQRNFWCNKFYIAPYVLHVIERYFDSQMDSQMMEAFCNIKDSEQETYTLFEREGKSLVSVQFDVRTPLAVLILVK